MVKEAYEEVEVYRNKLNGRKLEWKNFDKDFSELPLLEKNDILFYKRYLEQKSYKSIAENFGISVKGVEFHISKCLNILRKKLKDYLYDFCSRYLL